MIVEKRDGGYYCTICRKSYANFENINAECYFGHILPKNLKSF